MPDMHTACPCRTLYYEGIVKFLFRTDVHLSDKTPESWKGDYTSEVLSSLRQIGTLADSYKVEAVLDGGDFFHITAPSSTPHWIVEKAAEIHGAYPCPTYCVVGNHDISYKNLGTLERQPLGVLFATGVFRNLRESVFEAEGLKVRVVGVPYSPFRTLEELQAIRKQPGDTHLIAVVHALATERPTGQEDEFFREPVFRYRDLTLEGGPDAWCFPPGVPVLDNLYRPVPIESISKGVLVQGRSGPVSVEAVHPARWVREELVQLAVEGLPSYLCSTKEHPYWVAKGLKCRIPSRKTRRCHPDKSRTSYPCLPCDAVPIVAPRWVKSGQIEVGDYVATLVPRIPPDAFSAPGLARLLGYYAAEGHLIKNRAKKPVAGVAWSFHESEVDLQEDVRRLVREYFGLELHTHKCSGLGVQVCAYGKPIADFFREHVGMYSEKKSLSSWIWRSSAASRLEFLVGWLLGDGHVRHSRVEVMGATVSSDLAQQIYFLALSLGLSPRHSLRPERVSRFKKYSASPQYSVALPCNVISFYGDSGSFLARKLGVASPSRSKTKVLSFFRDGLYYTRVKRVSKVPYSGSVYNLRTSTGEYVAGGLLVHNCFGHWHKDQGVTEVEGRQFVNPGAVSRGSLARENLERTPQVAVLTVTQDGIQVELVPLEVPAPQEVFDLERKNSEDQRTQAIEQFARQLSRSGSTDPSKDIEASIASLDFAADVRDMALEYIQRAREQRKSSRPSSKAG